MSDEKRKEAEKLGFKFDALVQDHEAMEAEEGGLEPAEWDDTQSVQMVLPLKRYQYVHPACLNYAFQLDEMPAPMQAITSMPLYRMDGSPISRGQPIYCGHCGMLMHPRNLQRRHVNELHDDRPEPEAPDSTA